VSDLSRRPEACAGFKSLPGMLDISGVRCVCLSDGQLAGWDEVNTEICEWSADELTAAGGWRPCAYRLFGEAWSRTDVAKWFCKSYDTELEALTVALEKTP